MNIISFRTIVLLLAITAYSSAQAESARRLIPNYLFSDFEYMFEELDIEANQGDARAQMALGLFYLSGVTSADGSVPIPKDIEVGKAWLMRAIDSGNVCAMGVLAMEYAEGKNLPRDDVEADRWLRSAIAKGGPEAKIAMLERYDKGVAVPSDEHEVTRLIMESAAHGHPPSQVRAADYLQVGQQTPSNLAKAYQWMALAVKAEPENGEWTIRRDHIAAKLSQKQLQVANIKVEKWRPKGRSECDNPNIKFEFYRLN